MRVQTPRAATPTAARLEKRDAVAEQSITLKKPEIAPELWSASRRPWKGWLLCSGAALSVATVATLVPVPEVSYALFALAVVVFFAIPLYVTRLRLPRLAGEVDALSDKRAAQALQTRIREDFWVEQFAPSAWRPLQEARIQLVLEDGRAAAHHFAEVGRLGRVDDPRRRVEAARAHALLLAGDRREALEIFDELAERDVLEPIDALGLGIALLSEPARIDEARGHLERAREHLGDAYRVVCALALAHERNELADSARELVDLAESLESGASGDELADDLLKRAKKGLRALDKKGKSKKGKTRKNKSKPPPEDQDDPTAPAADAAAGDADPSETRSKSADPETESDDDDDDARGGSKKKRRKGKKARQQARREARKRRKAEERARKHEETQRRIAAARAGVSEDALEAASDDGKSGATTSDDSTPAAVADPTAAKAESKPAEPSAAEPKAEPEPAAGAEPKAEPEPAASPEPKAEPEPAASPEPESAEQRRAEPTAAPKPKPAEQSAESDANDGAGGAAIPRPPALGFGSGTGGSPRPFAAPKISAPKKPPSGASLFAGLDLPKPKSTSPATPVAPEPTAASTDAAADQPTAPSAGKPTAETESPPAKPVTPSAAVPFPDDLFAPPSGTGAPPSVTAPVVPPPPVLSGPAGPSPRPASAVSDDGWGDLFDTPTPGGVMPPAVGAPQPAAAPTRAAEPDPSGTGNDDDSKTEP